MKNFLLKLAVRFVTKNTPDNPDLLDFVFQQSNKYKELTVKEVNGKYLVSSRGLAVANLTKGEMLSCGYLPGACSFLTELRNSLSAHVKRVLSAGGKSQAAKAAEFLASVEMTMRLMSAYGWSDVNRVVTSHPVSMKSASSAELLHEGMSLLKPELNMRNPESYAALKNVTEAVDELRGRGDEESSTAADLLEENAKLFTKSLLT